MHREIVISRINTISPLLFGQEYDDRVGSRDGQEDFRGAGESDNFVRALADADDLGNRDRVLAFAERLHDAVLHAAAQARPGSAGATAILKKDRTPTEVYELIFGLTYLELRYFLLFQETQIEKLSPGQRGALLLIFYLFVDRGRNSINRKRTSTTRPW